VYSSVLHSIHGVAVGINNQSVHITREKWPVLSVDEPRSLTRQMLHLCDWF